MNVQAGIVAVVLTVSPCAATAECGEAPRPSALVVRTYGSHTVSTQDLSIARGVAESVFADAGIDLSWVDCGDSRQVPAPSPRCGQPVASNEIVLRIQTSRPVSTSRYASMGVSLVNGDSGGPQPVFSTVFADRVASVARGATVDARRVLGYAIAHEIGHLLLNNPRHPDDGLMRAVWSVAELRRNRAADWLFAHAEAEAMRDAVTRRTQVTG